MLLFVISYISQCHYYFKSTFTHTPPYGCRTTPTAIDSRLNRNFYVLPTSCPSLGLGRKLAWYCGQVRFISPQSHVSSFYKDISPNRLLRAREGVLLVSYPDPDQSIFVFHPGPVWISQPIRVHHSVHLIIVFPAITFIITGFWSRRRAAPLNQPSTIQQSHRRVSSQFIHPVLSGLPSILRQFPPASD